MVEATSPTKRASKPKAKPQTKAADPVPEATPATAPKPAARPVKRHHVEILKGWFRPGGPKILPGTKLDLEEEEAEYVLANNIGRLILKKG